VEQLKKHFYSWHDVELMCQSIVMQMYKDEWRPDYIVGLTRGGNIPATIISNQTDISCHALKISFRDDEETESNCWMSEDAFNGKKILVIDDINDTGETLNYLCQDWQRNCIPDDIKWDTVWDDNVRFATLTENMASGFGNVRYYSHEINKAEEDVWLVYPWESQV
jgi:hypoxanthine phosphoribosyltransferase|tara:strand:- start:1078 stop:1575 length:498 start_codon:yes stop_codon:yes gene_type:complete